MSVPSVTFPLEQSAIKATRDLVYKHLQGLIADTRQTNELLRTIQAFCSHAKKMSYTCPECGISWSAD